jgi:purine/pyrimidine-nucleoside phosphorylase
MLPGAYEFNTELKELMEILSGDLEIQLPGEGWKKISGGDTFEVPANSSFELKVHKVTDYCCSYLQEHGRAGTGARPYGPSA